MYTFSCHLLFLGPSSIYNKDTLSDTEIVEMVLEDAQIEGGANVDSDEDSEEPPPRLKKLMDL
ncbi:1209_t:CDS:2 [Entrophospora sp. SA101]|nr:1209_t:CDS:2 [Entrophospora sp. SA101]